MGEVCRTLAEQFFDVDTDIETALEVRTVPETQTVDPPVSRAELAMIRYIRRLHHRREPLELPPGAYIDAIASGWTAPSDSERVIAERDMLRSERHGLLQEQENLRRKLGEAREERIILQRELARAREQISATYPVQQMDPVVESLLTFPYQTRDGAPIHIVSGMCTASRNVWTR